MKNLNLNTGGSPVGRASNQGTSWFRKSIGRMVVVIFVALFCLSANATIWRVNNTGIPADFTTIQAAHDAVTVNPGDTIHVEPSASNYGGLTSSKQLIIIGTGYFLGSGGNPNEQQNTMTSNVGAFNFNVGSEGSVIQGLSFVNNDVNFYTDNITFLRNFVVNSDIILNAVGNISILQNYFVGYGIVGNGGAGPYSNIIIANNIIASGTAQYEIIFGGQYFMTISNNVIDGNMNTTNADIENNIISGIVAFGTNTIAYNLIGTTQFTYPSTNQQGIAWGTIFQGGITDAGYYLRGGSPAIGAGAGGVDCGAFGGPNPYVLSGMPSIPSVYYLSVPASTNSNTLPIVVSVKSNQSTPANIVQQEYFLNTDPGFGNGTPITNLTPSPNISNEPVNAILTNPNNGVNTFFIRAMDSLGNWSLTNTMAFNYIAPCTTLTPTITVLGDYLCSGNPEQLDAGGGYASYIWSTGDTTEVITPTGDMTYTVTVTNSSGCTGTASQYLNVTDESVNIYNSYSPNTICQNTTYQLYCVNHFNSQFTSYLWSTGSQNYFIEASTDGLYCVTVTDENGCTGTACIQVAVNPTPNISIISTICTGQPAQFDAGAGYASYAWADGETTEIVTPTLTGYYEVTVTDNSGCTASVYEYNDVLFDTLAIHSYYSPTTICQEFEYELYVYNANDRSYQSYLWSDGSNGNSLLVDSSGTYCVTVTDDDSCVATTCIYVSVIPSPVITSNGPVDFCQGGAVTLDAGSFASYLWNDGTTTETDNITVSGNYIVTVTNTAGCSNTAEQTVVADPYPTPEIFSYYSPTFCAGGSDEIFADWFVLYSSYLWSTGETAPNISVDSTATYYVTVTDAYGCTGTSSIDITADANLSPVITANGNTTFCQGGSVTLDAGPYSTFLWSDGSTDESDMITATGTYTVTVTDVNGCTGTASQNVVVNPNPTPVITANILDSVCDATSLVLDAGAGYASYDWYNWDASTNETLIPNYDETNTYDVEVTDVNGCTGTASYTQYVNNNTLTPVITANVPTTTCDPTTLASLTLDAGAGYATYYWYWDGSGNETLMPNYEGSYTYTVQVTDNNGCTGTGSIVITVNPTPYITITPSGATTICENSSVDLTALDYNDDGSDMYLWSNGSTDATITALSAGTYVVTITNDLGCSSTDSIAVMVSIPNPQMYSYYSSTFCQGGSDVLYADQNNNYDSYLWSNGSNNYYLNVDSAGIYSVTVSDAYGCTGVTSIVITDNPNPTPIITANMPTTTCDQNSLDSLILDAGAGYATYFWYSWDDSSNETLMPDYEGSNTYSVSVTDNNGCAGTASIVITLNPSPYLSIVPSGNATICQNSSVDLIIEDDNSDGFDTYNWSTGETTGIITVSIAGSYSVTVTNEFGCSSTDSIQIMVSIPDPQMESYYPSTFCYGDYDYLYADNNTEYASYVWSDGNQNGYYDYLFQIPIGSITYSVTVTDEFGCTGVTSIVITENPTPTPSVTPSDTTFCGNGILDAGAGYSSYYWTNSGDSTEMENVTSSGTYYVNVSNSYGCTAQASTDIIVNYFINPVIFGTSSFCTGDSTTLNVGYYSSHDFYLWSTGATTSAINVYTSGTYYVTVSDSNGCSAVDSITITVGGLSPVIYYSPATTVCQGTNVYLDAGYYDNYQYTAYLWSTGDQSSVINETDSGTYSVTVTDISGCTGIASIDITVIPAPSPTITADGPTSFCQGGSVTLDAGTGYNSYYWYPTGQTTQTISANENTTYYVQVTIGDGCTGIASIDITVSAAFNVTITSSGSDTICYGGNLTLDAGAGYASYDWYDPISSTDEAITAISTHSYTYEVQVTDSLGCIGNGYVFVTVNDPMGIAITANRPATFCEGDTVVLDAGAGFATYSWYDGETTETLTAFYSGNYEVEVIDANGCISFGSISLTEINNPVPTITTNTGSNSFCFGSSLILDAGSYASYVWSTGEVTEMITDSTSDNFNVTVTDANGCIGMTSIGTTELSPIDAFIANQTNASCNPGNDGMIIIGATGGGGYYVFSDDGGNTYQTSQLFQNLAIGIYNIVVKDQDGCTGSTSTTITVNTINPVITPLNPTTFNQGDSVILDAGSWASYAWSNGAMDEVIVVYTGGTYTVTVTDDGGCTGIASIVLTENSISCSITPDGSTTFCQGGSVTLDAGSFTSYMWSDGSTNETLNASTNGTYFVTVTDSLSNTCVASIDVMVNQNPLPVISGPFGICDGNTGTLDAGLWASYMWSTSDMTELITVDSANTYSVTVTDVNGCTGMASQVVTVNPNPTPVIGPEYSLPFCDYADLMTGIYASYIWSTGDYEQFTYIDSSATVYVTVTDDNGCMGTASYNVVVTPSPTPVITGNLNICAGQTTTLDAGGPYDVYAWSTGETTETITVSDEGFYYVAVHNGGCEGFVQVFLTVNANPNPSITPSGATTFCAGGSVSLDAGLWASYDWSNGDSSEAITVSTSGTYSVTIMDGNGCMGMASQAVTVNANPTPSIIPNGTTTFCNGGSVSLRADTSYAAYNWNTGATTFSILVSSAGTYNLTVTDGNGCHGMASQVVTVNSLPVATIQAAELSLCQGSTDMLIANVTGGSGVYTTYTWTPGTHPNSDTAVFNAASVGVKHWEVVVTDNNGCTSIEDTVTVTVNANPSPSITAIGNTTFCNGGSVTLDAGLWSSYDWSTGASSETISASTSGTYSVTITNGNGCSGMASTVVTVNPVPTPTIAANGPTSFCDGDSVGLDAGAFVSYLWNNGATNEAIIVYGSQPYCVTVTDVNGCTGANCITVNVFANPVASISGPTTICFGNSATFTAGTASTYTWSTGATTQSITANTSGDYCVTVTNSLGCSESICHSLTVFSALVPTITANGPTIFCATSSVTLDAGAGYSSYSWSNGATTETITVNTSNFNHVTVTNAAGCTGTAIQIVTVTPLITGLTIVGPTSVCQNTNVTLSTGTTYGTYLWSTGATTQSINVPTTGLYSVTVSNGSGCTAAAHQSVTFQTNPVVYINASGPLTFCNGGSVSLNVVGSYSSYLWCDGSTNYNLGPITTSGTYCVTVSYATGCTGAACVNVMVTSNLAPVITPGAFPTVCSAISMVIGGNQGFSSYVWNTGATTQYINIYTTNAYTLTVTNATGCTGSATFTPTGFCPKAAPVMTANPGFSNCGNTTLDAGAGYSSYLWSNSITTETNAITASGTYTVTVTTSCGCTGTTSHAVTVSSTANANITATGLATYCEGVTNVVLTAASNTAYLWSTGAVTQAITITPGNPETYSVTVTNASGCTGIGSEVVSNSCNMPTPNGTTNIAINGGMAQWFAPACFYGYTIQISVHNMNVWTQHTIAPNTHYMFSGLAANTMYDWQIQTNCNASGSINSGMSAITTFSTLARLEDNSRTSGTASFNVYPNPATDMATITFSSDKEDTYTMRLIDMTGRIVINESHAAVMGDNQYQLNLSELAKGVYMVVLQNNSGMLQKRIVVQ